MKKPKHSGGDRNNNPKHSFGVPRSQPNVGADMAAGEAVGSPVTQPAAAVNGAVTQDNVSMPGSPVTQPAAAVDGAATQDNVSLPEDVASDTAAPASAAGFPGEILENAEATSVDAYAVNISAAWHRTVGAVMSTARRCAQADARLTPQEKKELLGKLPFGEETFSKLVGIGNDLRLWQPEIQPLLPPHYTTLHVITTLSSEEFEEAVQAKVINAEQTRSGIEEWRAKHRKEVQEERAIDATVDHIAPPAPTEDPGKDNEPGVSGEIPVQGGLAQAPVPTVETAWLVRPVASEPMAADDVKSSSPSVVPTGDDNGTSVLDGPSLSADDQTVLDLLNETWDRASHVVRAQFRARIGAQALPI